MGRSSSHDQRAALFLWASASSPNGSHIENALPRMKKPILRPRVYSVQEVERLLRCPNPRSQTPSHVHDHVCRGPAGQRGHRQLRIGNLISERHQIHVVQGKGKKESVYIAFAAAFGGTAILLAPLPTEGTGCFPAGIYPDRHITEDAVQRAFTQAVEHVGLPRAGRNPLSLRAQLRHAFARSGCGYTGSSTAARP